MGKGRVPGRAPKTRRAERGEDTGVIMTQEWTTVHHPLSPQDAGKKPEMGSGVEPKRGAHEECRQIFRGV